MKRNPINIFNDTINKAKAMFECSYKCTIHSQRAKKLDKIDLRKYRGNPDKKRQIRKLLLIEAMKAGSLKVQLMMITSQPIQKHVFEPGSYSTRETKEEIILPNWKSGNEKLH